MATEKIYQKYYAMHDEHVSKYGDKTVILMMVGSFYEIYALPQGDGWIGPDLQRLEDILNIRITKKNKSKELGPKNPNMMGVPCDSAIRHQEKLLKADFTVVIVDQVGSSPNIERKIVAILSPSTMVEGYENRDTNYLLSMYLEIDITIAHKTIYTLGLSAVDVSTGKNYVHEVKSLPDEEELWLDEVYRIVHSYTPTEILVHADELSDDKFQSWCHRLQIDPKIVYRNFCQDREFHKISYQNQFYQKVYMDTGILEPIEYLGLESSTAMRMAHIYMVEFVYEHKIENVREISRPVFTPPEKTLVLTSNAIYQLYLVDSREHEGERYSSLMALLNKCQTAVGRRLVRERLLNPVVNPEILETRYATIEAFRETALCDKCRKPLKHISDIERAFRKMGVGSLRPDEFVRLDQSLGYLRDLADIVKDAYPMDSEDALCEWMQAYRGVFVLASLEDYEKTTKPFFVEGVSPVIDGFRRDLVRAQENLDYIRDRLGKIIEPGKTDIVKMKQDKNGISLIVTKKRATKLKERLRNMSGDVVFKDSEGKVFHRVKNTDIHIKSANKNDDELYFAYTGKLLCKIETLRIRIYEHSLELYQKLVNEYYRENRELFQTLVEFLGNVDLNACMAKIATENVYSKPEIVESDRSFLEATQIRHPLVEKIQTECEYVPNDVRLDESGVLLFGTNACGKSTLMKSVGLAIVMAQAGFYVACDHLRFSPYTQIFTRILNNDNIFRNQSSFKVEMCELRSILRKADQRSLVLGDELCSGTETISALSVVGSGLHSMASKKCSYIFTSHLHQLMEISEVLEIPNLRVCHMKVTCTKDNTLVYDRKLVEGSGPPVYGLEVCKAMDMGSQFDAMATKIYLKLTGQSPHLVNVAKSSYNAEIHMDGCGVCKKPSCEVHHIKEQQEADENGIIGNHHKNIKHNLVPLCHECHQKVHHGNLRIHGYQQTSQGIKLQFEELTEAPKPHSRKKLTTEDLNIMKPYVEKVRNNTLNLSECVRKLELEKGIKISSKILKKVKEGVY